MELSVLKFIDRFNLRDLKGTLLLTWLFVAMGLLLYIIFVILAFQTEPKSLIYYFLENVGIILMFTSFLMAYAGVYHITTVPGEGKNSASLAIRATFRKAHYIIGASLLTIIMITIVILIEAGISYIGLIPEVGPIILTVLTIPFFIVNFLCLLFAMFVFVLVPPLASEASGRGDLFNKFKITIKERWVGVLIYFCLSLSILLLSLLVIYYIAGHAAGLTKSIQWNISRNYPRIFDALTKYSYFSDIAARIAPESGGLGIMGKYQLGPVTYEGVVAIILYFSYTVLFSFIISFPLSVYFRISSIFLSRVKE